MRVLCTVLLLFVLSSTAQAYTPELASLPTVAQLRLNVESTTSAVAAAKPRPLQFAVGAALEATVADGSWDEPEAGIGRWRLRIASEGARSLSFHIEGLVLPAGAQLYLYTIGGADLQGPFTSSDNGSVWLPLVQASEAVLEARMPLADRPQFAMHLAQVFHGYRSFAADTAKASLPGAEQAGACNVDVSCPAGAAWAKETQAVVALTISNQFICSGSLINNTRQDERPLILSAHHCDYPAASPASIRAYFNVQQPRCGSNAPVSTSDNLQVASVLAQDRRTDYTLLLLASVPPASYKAYYAGWDARGVAPGSGVAIHHPSGDDKKISSFTRAATAEDSVPIDTFSVDAWGVVWSSGTTEPGSSGSALWNQDHRIVGTLSGGNAECSGDQTNGESDYFARFDKSFAATTDSGARLKAILDPASSGCLTLDGKAQGAAPQPACSTTGSGGPAVDGGGGGGSFGLSVLLPLALAALRRRAIGSGAIGPRACRA